MRPHLKMSGTPYRLDETDVKVGTEWKYLYRAADSAGDTIEFMLSARRDVSAAKRFFKKLMKADHRPPIRRRDGQSCLLPGGVRDFSKGESLAVRLQAAADQIPQQRHRARPPGE
jgi:hypothetical protein